MSDQLSIADCIAHRLVHALGRDRAHEAIDLALQQFTVTELAALANHWDFWGRPKQLPPQTEWRSFGFLTSRGFGKTFAVSNHVNREVQAGRAKLIGLAAQKEDRTIDVQVLGSEGLIATAPPWFRPVWEASSMQLVWPNGARALALTPEVPGAIRGDNYDLFWACELQSWPHSTMIEAFNNILLSTRKGYARLVWDCTPKKGHPILLQLLARAKSEPDRHVVVRGTIHENRANLSPGVIEDLEKAMGGTQRGREELLGEMLEDSDAALFKLKWINDARRVAPDRYLRRGIAIDPAVTKRAGSDRSGLVEGGLGLDGQGYVIGDYSGKYAPHEWAKITLDRYVDGCLDFVICETNKGGDLVVQNLRSAANERKLSVVLVGKDERPQHVTGVVFVKEVHARGAKQDRAQPLATAYERGRISHVVGANLTELENTMTSWEPTPTAQSPDDLDACVHVMSELLDLTSAVQAPETAEGIAALTEAITTEPTNTAAGQSIAQLFGQHYMPSGGI